MKRKLFLFLLLFLVIVTTTFVYINKIFLPIQLKDIITEKASAALNRKVELGALHFNPFKGIVLDDLRIYRRTAPEELFVHIHRASFHLLYTPLITQKKVIIPSMHIETPSIHLVRGTDGVWNFQDLLTAPQEKKSDGLLVGTILVHDGRVKVTDKRNDAEYTDFVENVHIDTTLSVKKGAQFLVQFKIPADNASFSLHGHYDFLDETLNGTVKFNELHPARLLRFVDHEAIPDLRQGRLSEGNITFSYDKEAITAHGHIMAEEMDLYLANGDHLTGQIKAHKASLTRKDDAWRFSGLLASKGITYARQDGTMCSTQFRSSVKNIAIEKATTAVFGLELTGTDCSMPSSGLTFQGGLTTQQTVLSLGEDWSIKTDVVLQDSKATLGEGRSFDGSIDSPSFSLQSNAEGLLAEGSLTANIRELNLAPEQTVKGMVSLENARFTRADGKWMFLGKAELREASLRLPKQSAEGTFSLNNATLTFEHDVLTLNGGVTATNAKIATGQRNVKGDFHLDDIVFRSSPDLLQLNTNLTMENGEIALTENITFFGSPRVQLSVEQRQGLPVSYSGQAQFVKGILRGLPDVDQVNDLSGTIAFQNDQARTESLSFNALNAPIEIQGDIQGFNDPVLSVRLLSPEISLAKVQSAFPAAFEKTGIILDGTAKMSATFSGKPNDIANATISGEAVLNNVSLSGSRLPDPITGLGGTVRYQSNLVEWERLSGQWKGQELVLTGRLADFKRPSITTTVKGSGLDASADLTLLRSAMDIRSLKGSYAGQSFDIHGQLDLAKGQTPSAQLNIKADLDLASLASAHTALAGIIERHSLDGQVHVEGAARGPLNTDWPAWDVDFQMSAPTLGVRGYTMQEAMATLITRSRQITKFAFNALFYEGRLELVGSADLAAEKMPYNAALRLENANITQLKAATALKEKNISGYLSSTFVGTGLLKSPQSVEGKGSINISEGMLWELNMLKGLLTFLLIPEYKDITFTAARCNFEVKNRQLITDSLELISPKLTLAGKGIINFDQSINMHISPRIDPGHILKSESLKKGPTAILLQGQQIVSVRITGNLKHPKYEVDKSIGKALENATGAVVDGVMNIFGDIF